MRLPTHVSKARPPRCPTFLRPLSPLAHAIAELMVTYFVASTSGIGFELFADLELVPLLYCQLNLVSYAHLILHCLSLVARSCGS